MRATYPANDDVPHTLLCLLRSLRLPLGEVLLRPLGEVLRMELCEVLARGSDCDSADNFLAPRLAFLAWIHSEFMFRVWVSGFKAWSKACWSAVCFGF